MVRIRVISLKKILINLLLLLILFIIVSISLIVLKNILQFNVEDTNKRIIDSTLLAYNSSPKYNESTWILNNELGFFHSIGLDDDGEKIEQPLDERINKNDAITSSIKSFNVEKISDSKYKIGSVYINSYLKQNIDLQELSEPLKINISRPCRVLIYHTHTSESYTIDSRYSDYYRTEDDEYNVVAVGKALSKYLTDFGFEVVQDVTKHDYPSYNGAYKASLATVEKHLKNEEYDIIFDIHRDALSGNSKFRPTTEINGETAAKIMIVVGTNDAGLKHDNWMQNFKFAIALQEKGNEMYPGLFRDMHLSTSRYNQHTSDKTLIIEVGATGNTIEETKIAMKYFANVLNDLIKM